MPTNTSPVFSELDSSKRGRVYANVNEIGMFPGKWAESPCKSRERLEYFSIEKSEHFKSSVRQVCESLEKSLVWTELVLSSY